MNRTGLEGRIGNTDGSILPSKEVVGSVCESILELLFPGVYGEEPIYSPHDHGTGVVIGETSKIGSHVKLYQGVALIARSLSAGQALHGQKRHPTIEENVTIYSGSSIMGGDTVVGAGRTIGANVFLTHSVPVRSVVFYDDGKLQIRSKDKQPGGLVQDWMI